MEHEYEYDRIAELEREVLHQKIYNADLKSEILAQFEMSDLRRMGEKMGLSADGLVSEFIEDRISAEDLIKLHTPVRPFKYSEVNTRFEDIKKLAEANDLTVSECVELLLDHELTLPEEKHEKPSEPEKPDHIGYITRLIDMEASGEQIAQLQTIKSALECGDKIEDIATIEYLNSLIEASSGDDIKTLSGIKNEIMEV